LRAAVALAFDVGAGPVMLASDPSLAARAPLMSHQRPHGRDRGPGNGGNRSRAGSRLR